MKIVHINLVDQYNENWSYQDNLLPRMHKRAGHDVTLITTCRTYNGAGEIVTISPQNITLSDGVKLIRIEQAKKFPIEKFRGLFTPYDILDLLTQLHPDLIMVHGMTVRYANKDVLKYIKKINPKCVLVTDTHNCEINASAHLAKTMRERMIARFITAMWSPLYKYSKKIFAITPACGKYAAKYHKAPAEKIELLPLGYDPDILPWEQREKIRKEFREKHQFCDEDIVIVHGGKIIRRRKTTETIEAVAKLKDPRVKLVVFGGIDEQMQPEVEAALKKHQDRVTYLGHLTPEEYHRVYYGADIALFPGGQSVLWQQAIGCGLPIVVGNDKDLEYLNRGGNAAYIDDASAEGIYQIMEEILSGKKYATMKEAAQGEAREFFSYERIAKQVTDCVE